MSSSSISTVSRPDRILSQFTTFRSHLDAHTDKRERLIKLSRDITALSKKLIFLLHRLSLAAPAPPAPASLPIPSSSSTAAPLDPSTLGDAMVVDDHGAASPGEGQATSATTSSAIPDRFAEARQKDSEIRVLFEKIGNELRDEAEFWLYERNVSGGLQEYIEGISFMYWLEHSGGLISLQEVQSRLSDADGRYYFPVTNSDYILGLSDLSGELMRYTLNAIGLGKHDEAVKTLGFVRQMKQHFDQMTTIPNLWKKQEITAQSLAKIENAAYQVALRRQEFAGREDVLGEMVRRGLAASDEGLPSGADGGGAEGGGGQRGGGERKRKQEGEGERSSRGGRGGRGGKN